MGASAAKNYVGSAKYRRPIYLFVLFRIMKQLKERIFFRHILQILLKGDEFLLNSVS